MVVEVSATNALVWTLAFMIWMGVCVLVALWGPGAPSRAVEAEERSGQAKQTQELNEKVHAE